MPNTKKIKQKQDKDKDKSLPALTNIKKFKNPDNQIQFIPNIHTSIERGYGPNPEEFLHINSEGLFTVANRNNKLFIKKISEVTSSAPISYRTDFSTLKKLLSTLQEINTEYTASIIELTEEEKWISANVEFILFIENGTWKSALYLDKIEREIKSMPKDNLTTILEINYKQAKLLLESHSVNLNKRNEERELKHIYLDFDNNRIITADGYRLHYIDVSFKTDIKDHIALNATEFLSELKHLKQKEIIKIETNTNENNYFINGMDIEKGDALSFNSIKEFLTKDYTDEAIIITIEKNEAIKLINSLNSFRKFIDKDRQDLDLCITEDKMFYSVGKNTANGSIDIINKSKKCIDIKMSFTYFKRSIKKSSFEIAIKNNKAPVQIKVDNETSLIMCMKM